MGFDATGPILTMAEVMSYIRIVEAHTDKDAYPCPDTLPTNRMAEYKYLLHAQWLQAVVPQAWYKTVVNGPDFPTNHLVGKVFFALLDTYTTMVLDSEWYFDVVNHVPANLRVTLHKGNYAWHFVDPHQTLRVFDLPWYYQASDADFLNMLMEHLGDDDDDTSSNMSAF